MTAPTVVESGDLGFSYEMNLDIDMNFNTPAAGTPDWLPLAFITDVDPKNDKTFADASTYADEGAERNAVVGEKWEITFVHQLQRDPTTGLYITVLAKLVKCAAFGARNKDAQVSIRWYDRGGADDAWQGVGYVARSRSAKNNKDIGGFSFTITGNGVAVPIDNPLAVGA